MQSLDTTNAAIAIQSSWKVNRPIMVWGQPGTGKSALAAQIAESRNAHLVDIRLSQYDSVDLRGVPSLRDGLTVWNAPATLPFAGNPNFTQAKEVILFLDEINAAPPSVAAVAYQLINDRRVGEHVLMDNVKILAAGNREGDRGVVNRMPSPLANRFVHLEIVPQLDSLIAHALQADWDPIIIAFLRNRPDLLTTFDPSKPDKAFATPRTWEFVSDFVKQSLPTPVEFALVSGSIGEGPAAEFVAYKRIWQSMPDPDMIIMDPAGSPVPDDSAVLYATVTALASRAKKDNFDSILEYAARLHASFRVLLVKDSIQRNPLLAGTKAYTKFLVANAALFGN